MASLPYNLARNSYFIESYTYMENYLIIFYTPLPCKVTGHSLKNLMEPIKSTWKEMGVSTVSDGWSDSQTRPLINVMAMIEDGPMFLNALNVEGKTKNIEYIQEILLRVIEEVGPQNVVQVITDNEPVYKAAGGEVEIRYPHIFWIPCVVDTLNLALKNICPAKNTKANEVVYEECSWITEIVGDVMMVRNFIMNHSMRLSIFDHHVSLKMPVIAKTRFASAIIMLQRFKDIKA